MKRLARLAAALLDPVVPLSFTRPGHALRRCSWDDPAIDIDLTGRACLVTGANGGLGRAISRGLAARGATVRMVCRSAERGRAAVDEVAEATGSDRLHLDLLDVSDLDAVAAYAAGVQAADVLIHNAGALLHDRVHSPQGLEQTAATHVAGPFCLTRALHDQLAASADARVIWMASGGMYTVGLDVDALFDPPEPFDGITAYARAKRAQVVLAAEFARRDDTARHEAMQPGWTDTGGLEASLPRFHRLLRPLLRDPEQGADTALWLAASPDLPEGDGSFWRDRVRRRTVLRPGTRPDDAEVERLWERCAAACP